MAAPHSTFDFAPPPSPVVTRAQATQTDPFGGCMLKKNLLATLHDNLNCAWNSWELACKFDDEDKQELYMKYVTSINDLMKKVRRF